MGQSQTSKFDTLFTLICTDNTEELTRRLRSCSSPEQTKCLSNLSDADKAATLLMYAAFYGNLTICRLLFESGAQLLSRDNEGHNVLFYAMAGQAYNVAKYLIETANTQFDDETRKEFINNLDNTGETCLHEAVKIHAISCIELLIKHDIDINIANRNGNTALHRAVDLGLSDIVRLLIKYKAELNTKDLSGWTPLHVACAHNDIDLVRLLISRGARLNVTDNRGCSLLKWVHETGSREIFEYLKSHSSKEVDSTTRNRRTSERLQRTKKDIPKSHSSSTPMSKSLPNDTDTFLN
ncbi:unnamed protein product [Rotaria magnacalcarata]|uniref:Uncharacterized protein n=1 Tax=Rotaria magnacalcarata TaxID=392030 RepID=A0A816AM18_9BILA|nr:unnamed protein product [Rotaria magnacalcarata]CAF1597498.1 unnamed protein product [Rotaria magnacalcarata]CAF2194006.1 unnamed protein product [Rotaria magnacalcarata]CAF3819522.1 unnamed protein product [Rotaria magnacalcarata]CAF3848863.1 unnamed protein product [Rotaria magnacalcarata]